jgi:hypothetical protein
MNHYLCWQCGTDLCEPVRLCLEGEGFRESNGCFIRCINRECGTTLFLQPDSLLRQPSESERRILVDLLERSIRAVGDDERAKEVLRDSLRREQRHVTRRIAALN